MASFQIVLTIAIFLCLNGPTSTNCQSNTLEERLYAAISLLTELEVQSPVNNLARFSERETFLDILKSLVSLIKDTHTLEETLEEIFEDDSIGHVLAAVANDACSWVRNVMENESFNCSETELDSLITRVEFDLTPALGIRQFRRVCDTCTRDVTAQIEWVMNNIPCTGNGELTRDYLANDHVGFANRADRDKIRCPATTTIPATIMS